MKPIFNIDKMIEIDDTGMPKAPGARQLLDKDILTLYMRDKTRSKENYIKECGVIYYLGDPKSPAMQQGLSTKEALKLAKENFDLDKDYQPDALVLKLIDKYWKQNITPAGIAIDNLRKTLHLASQQASKINELLSNQLNTETNADAIRTTIGLIGEVRNIINSIPNTTKALATAYENLQAEEEQQLSRGGNTILSSMNADEG